MADADLTSLVMNMMNNAITGAKNAGVDQPQITIDVHVKDHWLVIKCSNSAETSKHLVPKKEETVPKHGLGLKIMADIANRYRGVFSTEAGEADFKVTVSFSLYENA
jgi:sensor histidine kinase regulating citrate/malate metabolism